MRKIGKLSNLDCILSFCLMNYFLSISNVRFFSFTVLTTSVMIPPQIIEYTLVPTSDTFQCVEFEVSLHAFHVKVRPFMLLVREMPINVSPEFIFMKGLKEARHQNWLYAALFNAHSNGELRERVTKQGRQVLQSFLVGTFSARRDARTTEIPISNLVNRCVPLIFLNEGRLFRCC